MMLTKRDIAKFSSSSEEWICLFCYQDTASLEINKDLDDSPKMILKVRHKRWHNNNSKCNTAPPLLILLLIITILYISSEVKEALSALPVSKTRDWFRLRRTRRRPMFNCWRHLFPRTQFILRVTCSITDDISFRARSSFSASRVQLLTTSLSAHAVHSPRHVFNCWRHIFPRTQFTLTVTCV